MPARRDVLKGLGAGLGLSGLSLGAIAYRALLREDPLLYVLGQPGPAVDAPELPEPSGKPLYPTLSLGDGPLYIPKSPRRRDLRARSHGGRELVVRGRVLDASGRPLAGAVLDIWQTDAQGAYDVQGYGYRGHQFSDSDGRYELITVRPQEYYGLGAFRTPHIHVKLQGLGSRSLATQIFFPDEEPANAKDLAFDESLQVALGRREGSLQMARFDFVLEPA